METYVHNQFKKKKHKKKTRQF